MTLFTSALFWGGLLYVYMLTQSFVTDGVVVACSLFVGLLLLSMFNKRTLIFGIWILVATLQVRGWQDNDVISCETSMGTVFRGKVQGSVSRTPSGPTFTLDTCGGIRLFLKKDLKVQSGDDVEFTGRLVKPRGYWTQGASSELARSSSFGVAWIGRPDDASIKVIDSVSAFSIYRFTDRFRNAIESKIVRQLGAGDSELLKALLLGIRPESSIKESFKESGMIHILVISGFHVGFLLSVLWWLGIRVCVYLGLTRWIEPFQFASVLSLAIGAGYCFSTGMGPASLRALIMATFCLLPKLINIEVSVKTSLMFACMAMLSFRPHWILDFGFQCSFLISGVLICLPTIHCSDWSKWKRMCCSLFCANVMAFAASIPLLLNAFGRFNPYSWLANIVVFPLVALVSLPFGFLGGLLPENAVGYLLLSAASLGLKLVFIVSECVGQWQLEWSLASSGVVFGMFSCQFIFLLAWHHKRTDIIFCSVLGWFLFLGWSQRGPEPSDGELSVTFVDVGQGDAAWISFPNGQNWLVDVGGIGFGKDSKARGVPTKRSLVPVLKANRVKRIDKIVLSHLHADHVAGLLEIHQAFSVGKLMYLEPLDDDQTFHAFEAMANRLFDEGVGFERPHQNQIILGDVSVSFWAPESDGTRLLKDPILNENNNSLVLKLQYRGRSILFLGDLEHEGEELLQKYQLKSVDVVKAGHHGSKTSSTERLVEALRPEHVVFSLGHLNRFHFPDPGVLARWKNVGAQLWRTDVQGSIKLSVSNHGYMELKSFVDVGRQ